MSFFLLEIQEQKKETELTFCLFCIKKPENRKLILQELLVLLVLAQLLVLLVLLGLVQLLVLQGLLVLLVLAQLLVLLQELQFFLRSLRKRLSLKERGIRKVFSLLDYYFCCLIIDSFISSRILKKNSDFSKAYCMAEYAKYFHIPPH